MLGKSKTVIDTTVLDNGDSLAAYITSAAGTLLTHTTNGAKEALDVYGADVYADGTAHNAGDIGSYALAVDDNGDYAPLSVNASGELLVSANFTMTSDFAYAEDSASANGDVLAAVAMVRQDTLAASTGTDGDYAAFKGTAAGELYVFDTVTHTSLTTANGSLSTIVTNTGNTATNTSTISSVISALSKAEDAAHSSGDQGIQMLAVRNDTPGSLSGTNGDYSPLQVDATGNLRVSGSITISGQYAEDAAATSGDIGLFTLGVRRDAQAATAGTAGDYTEFQTWSEGSLKVVDIRNGAILQQRVAAATTATLLPPAALANRKTITIQNAGSASIWVGSATVTTTGAAAGLEIPKGGFVEFNLGPAVSIYGIVASGTVNANILEAA